MGQPSAAYDAFINSFNLRQCSSAQMQGNVEVIKGRYSGGLDPQAVFVKSAEPKATWETGDLAGLLGAVSLSTGLFVASGAGTITLPYNTRNNGGTFAGAGANSTLTATGGLTVITDISAEQDSDDGAKASLEFTPIWDGTNALFVANINQTLSAQAFVGQYALGPAKLNGTTIEGLTGVSCKPGLKLLIKRYKGEPFARAIFIQEREPTFELTFEDLAHLNAFGALFVAVGTTALIYLRHRADGSTFDADGSASHILLTLTGGLSITDSVSASGTDDAAAKLMIHGKTLVASTASAIS